jgi:uncharacterized Zn finger protein (UPF0148 family)
MAKCEKCGKKTGWFRVDGKLLCGDCRKEVRAGKTEEALEAKALFLPETTDEEIIQDILEDMGNLAGHEAGTKWMRMGTLLSGNATEQMLGAGFKALIDQNKIIIRQNELILRQMRKDGQQGTAPASNP